MKKIMSLCLVVGLTMSVGCSKSPSIPAPEPTVEVIATPETVEDANYKVTSEDFKDLFKKYFSLKEEDMLLINQNPSIIHSEYVTNQTLYSSKITGALGKYLTDDVKKLLNTDYLYEDFHFPRKLSMNGYVTFDSAVVEGSDIISTRLLENNTVYEVSVTTKNKVQRMSDVLSKYTWSEKGNYLAEALSSSSSALSVKFDEIIKDDNTNAYLFLEGDGVSQDDEIKLVHRYWVEVETDKEFKIASIREAAPIQRDGITRQVPVNTSHVTRIPYYSEASAGDQKVLSKVFNQLMNQSKDFYYYYEKAMATDFDMLQVVWIRDLELKDQVTLSKDTYRETYGLLNNPYKDNFKRIETQEDKMTIATSIYGTQHQPRFIVTIPAKVRTNKDKIIFYNYKYYVGMEKNKVEFIRFMNMEAIDEATYNGAGIEPAEVIVETPVEAPVEVPAE